MKNVIKVFGIVALIAIFGFSFAACDNATGGGGGDGGGSIPAALAARWYFSQADADVGGEDGMSGFAYEFKADGTWIAVVGGVIGKISVSGNTITTYSSAGYMMGTAQYSIIETRLSLYNVGMSSGLVENYYYKKGSSSSGGGVSLNWTNVSSPFSTGETISGIVYGNGKFIAVGSALSYPAYAGKIAYSTDGQTWSIVADSQFPSSGINSVTWGNDKFVAVGGKGQIAYSADGQTWTAVTDGKFGTDYEIKGIACGNGKFVAVGEKGKMAYSADGQTWTAVEDSTFYEYFSGVPSGRDIYDVAWDDNKFVAVGYGRMTATSPDGVNWTGSKDEDDNLAWQIFTVVWGNNKWVAGGTSSTASYSADGGNWTASNGALFYVTGQGTGSIMGIAFGNNKFVAVGYNDYRDRFAYSTDGINWTTGSSIFGMSNQTNCIAYGDGKWVVGGKNGKMAIAADE